MNKKYLEITTAIGSVLLFIVLLILVNISGMTNPEYGFAASVLVFVLVVSAVGIKLVGIE